MAGIFSRPKPPPPPSVDPELERQRQKAERDEVSSRRRLAARRSARRTGGRATLMAPGVYGEGEGRDVTLTTTLGAGRNPRG